MFYNNCLICLQRDNLLAHFLYTIRLSQGLPLGVESDTRDGRPCHTHHKGSVFLAHSSLHRQSRRSAYSDELDCPRQDHGRRAEVTMKAGWLLWLKIKNTGKSR